MSMKILHIVYGFNGGGVGFVIANYCANTPMPNIHFDIVGEDIGKPHLLHEKFEHAGFHVYYVTAKKKSLIKNILEMYSLIRDGKYDAVHVHFEEWSFLYLWIAMICGVKVRICHSHTAHMIGASKKPHYILFRFLLNKFSTLRIACSKDAGEHLFGHHKYTLLNNAIDVKQYVYNSKTRDEIRNLIGISDKFVVGVVGRITHSKNPRFTVEIFSEIHKIRPDSVLLFVGRGELEQEIHTLVTELHLDKSVRFLGQRPDVPRLLQAMDAFVLPSLYEGLGIVYIEAQAAGLKTFATENVVPQEACLSNSLFKYIPQDASPKQWADTILANADYQREDTSTIIRRHGYDIDQEINKLRDLYINNIGG